MNCLTILKTAIEDPEIKLALAKAGLLGEFKECIRKIEEKLSRRE